MRGASHHTLAMHASVVLGLRPQLPSVSLPPHPCPFRDRAQSCRNKQKRANPRHPPPPPVLLSAQLEAL